MNERIIWSPKMTNNFKFQPTQMAEAVQKKLFIKRLPEWMQGLEDIQKVSDDVIQQWFNPAENELVDGYIGDMGSPAAAGNIFLHESTVARQLYQLSTAYVSRNDDSSIRSIQFYDDLVGYMNHYGALTENESRLFNGKFYSWTPPINPNKMNNYSSYLWDSKNSYNIATPDYIVMERGAENGNTWSLQNFWYTLGETLEDGTILTEELMQDSRFVRARAPIIEYNKNIELMNYGTKFRGTVDLFSDIIKPEDIVQKDINSGIRIDGIIPQDGMRILFTSIGNNGENNRIYKVYVKRMQDGTRVYGLALDPDEESESRPSGEPQDGDVVLIIKGNEFGNSSMYWDGSHWIQAQSKTSVNVFPQFQLYDRNGVKLNNTTTYPSSTFTGSSLFGFKINYNYATDSVYGYNIELGDYNYYTYENFLQSTRYTYEHLGVEVEIDGLYYYNVIGEGNTMNLETDWVRSTEYSKQYVKQTPQVERTVMFRVFSTVYDMESFKEPVEGMYAYVIEVDRTYQYYKAERETYLDWHVIVGDGVQSVKYNHTFELAQKVLDNSDDIIELVVDGVEIKEYTKTVVNNQVQSITIDSSVDLDEDSVVQIRTYSSTITPNKELGAYEVPINLQNNPYNSNIEYINQGDYTLHFQDIIQKNITSGSADDFNNYEERLAAGLVNNGVGTKIIQNEASMLPLMAHTANEDIDLFESIMFMQAEYFRFINKFNTQMLRLYEEDPSAFLGNSASNIVDAILTAINMGRDSTFPFYYDNVASTAGFIRAFVPPTPQFLGILQAYTPQKATFLTAGSKSSWYNISHTGIISKAYRVINGVDKMDDVVFELENRIFNSIDLTFKDIDYKPVLNSEDLFPTPYFTGTDYSAEEKKTLLLRGYINFTATNGISNSTHDYDANNWRTWNYTGSYYVVDGQRTEIPARGSWRAIYTDQYGTYRPATHPWEMMGFSQRPTWWNQEYEPTAVQVGEREGDVVYVYEALVMNESGDLVPSGLWDIDGTIGDSSTGTILSGERRGQYDKYKRFGVQPFKITKTGEKTSTGIDICEVEYIAPEVLGLVSGNLDHRAEPWAYGDMGDMEFTYMNTAMFAYDQMLLLYKAKPAQFANYYWDTRNDNLKPVYTDGSQFLYGETRKRLNFDSTTLVHGEKNTRTIGYQMFVSDYLMYQNKNITTKYGDVVRSSYVNVAHKIGGFTKADQLTFTAKSFGLISQENQTIGLVRSNNIRDEQMSAVKITWNGSAYQIDGYDLVGAKFKYKIPVKNGRKVTLKLEDRTVVHYNEWKSEGTLEYGKIFNTYQEVYTFICGYGEYLKEHGWIFEDVNDSGAQQDWTTIAKDFVIWSQNNLSTGEFISCTPSAANAKFGADFGSVQSVTQNSGGVWSLLDDENQGIRQYEIETSRIGNVFTVRTTSESQKRMALIRLSLSSYEHAVVFDDKTIFGDYIYQPTYGAIQELIKMYGYITGSWTGRLQAPGFIILEAGTLPSFEKLVTDFELYYNSETPVSDVQLQELSNHLIGYQTRDYLQRMISSDVSRVDFYKGFIHDKGTNQVMEKVLRVSKSYDTDEYKALQEWAFKIGTYGNINGKKNLQFKLINDQFKQQPQMVSFDVNATSNGTGNGIVYYGEQGVDSRWITRPNGKFSFPMRSGRSENIQLPDIGPVTLDEISYVTKDFSTAYNDRINYMNNSGEIPDSVWMFKDGNDLWNIFELVDTEVEMLSIVPIENTDVYAEQFCKVTLSDDIPLNDGDYYYFVDETNFMPDTLTIESQYYTAGNDPRVMVVPFDTSITIDFTDPDTRPRLYRYVSRFSTEEMRQEYIDRKYSFKAPQSTLFDRPTTYDERTNITALYLNVFDPINGVIPGAAMQNVTYTSPVDPAQYNSNGELIQAWGADKVGQVWWNTSTAFYLDYTRAIYDADGNVDVDATNEYKRYNWGRLLPHSTVDVLEWVCSPVEPYNWDKYCKDVANKNKNNTMYLPSGTALEDNYSTFLEYDSTTDTYVTKYYFWVRDTIYVPPLHSRTKSCTDIARIIKEPAQLNIPWFAPINESSFILSNMQFEVNDDTSILTVSYYMDNTEVIKHDQYQLCKEGDSYNFNPSIWTSMWNSMIGQETTESGTVIDLLYPLVPNGLGSNKTWFQDVIEARRNFVESANNYYRSQNITTNTVLMDEVFNVKTTEVNPNEVSYRVLTYNSELVIAPESDKFKENDAVLVSTSGVLPNPLSTSSVYFVHIDANGYIHLMNSPSSAGSVVTITLENRGEGQQKMIKQSDYVEALGTSLDMTQYWSLADWYDIGYDKNTAYTQESSLEDANTKNYQVGDIIRITDVDGIWTLYIKAQSRDSVYWKAIGRENSTVELNDMLYADYTVRDANGSLSNREINVRKALALLKNSFDLHQSEIVFDMVKYVHVEQSVVDWVFKTSYIYIVGLEQSLVQNYSNDNLINQIVEYFEEVKPYRTKIRSQIEQKTSDDDLIKGLCNDLDPNGYIFADGTWVKTEKDIWDYEYAQFNEVTQRWEQVGELPSDFVTPNRRFQEIDVIMHYDNTQCKPNDNLASVDVLEEVNKKYQSNAQDVVSNFELQRYKYTFPEYSDEDFDLLVAYQMQLYYPELNVTLGIAYGVNQWYADHADDLVATAEFTETLNRVYKESTQNEMFNDVNHYVQYNTLSNRLKLYTGADDEVIHDEVGCGFSGLTYDDNPSTRLPFGYASSTDYNFGYFEVSSELYKKYVSLIKENNTTATDDEVRIILEVEYGVYSYRHVDEDGNQRFYNDAIHVLSGMRGLYDKDATDHYEKAEEILSRMPIDIHAFTMMPRKYVYVNVNGVYESIPDDQSIDDFMEDKFITDGQLVQLAEINLDDLPLDRNNPMYSDYQHILDSITDAKYYDDMNAFDNLALESQTSELKWEVEGDEVDPYIIDISDINPSGRKIGQIRFTVDGYGFNSVSLVQLRDNSRYKTEGMVIINPYKTTEAIVSIPSYAKIENDISKSYSKYDEKYFYKIKSIVSDTEAEVIDNTLSDGDKVMIFTTDGEDYVRYQNNAWETILSVSKIKTDTTPTLYTVRNTANGTVELLDSTGVVLRYDNITKQQQNEPAIPLALNIVRIRTFADPEFLVDGVKLYETNRNYAIDAMNYEVFYDTTLYGGSYNDGITPDDVDVWVVSNEIFEVDGVTIDNGYNLPITGAGVLSELVRTKMTDSVEINVFEYDVGIIQPVLNTEGVWEYAYPLVSDTYIGVVGGTVTNITAISEENATYVSQPDSVSPYSVTNNVLSGAGASMNDIISLGFEKVEVRFANNLLRGVMYSAEHDFKENVTYSFNGLNLGKVNLLKRYSVNSYPIELSVYSDSLQISGNDIKNLLEVK